MKRWLILLLGLGIAAAAGVALLSFGPPSWDTPSWRSKSSPSGSAGREPPRVSSRPLHGEADRKTEAQLKEILRSAEAQDARSR